MPIDPPWKRCAVDGHPLCEECYEQAVRDGLVDGKPEMKVCRLCGQAKPDIEFSIANKTGARRKDCKACKNRIEREKYQQRRAK